jgi:hypothetical protein
MGQRPLIIHLLSLEQGGGLEAGAGAFLAKLPEWTPHGQRMDPRSLHGHQVRSNHKGPPGLPETWQPRKPMSIYAGRFLHQRPKGHTLKPDNFWGVLGDLTVLRTGPKFIFHSIIHRKIRERVGVFVYSLQRPNRSDGTILPHSRDLSFRITPSHKPFRPRFIPTPAITGPPRVSIPQDQSNRYCLKVSIPPLFQTLHDFFRKVRVTGHPHRTIDSLSRIFPIKSSLIPISSHILHPSPPFPPHHPLSLPRDSPLKPFPQF